MSRESEITFVFSLLRQIIDDATNQSIERDWLYILEEDAHNGIEFVAALKGYFRGLKAAKVIGIEHIDDMYKVLIKYHFI
ncbi:MAG: hypothetical protein ACRBCI_00790 [Cellvibrionaceae bacterium]